MPLFIDLGFNLGSHRTQLLLTAATAALATYSILSIHNSRSRAKRRADLANEVNRAVASGTLPARIHPSPSSLLQVASGSEYSEELVREQLARNYAFLGEQGVARVRKSTVVIVGCGGVGSWAAVMLARSGVAHLRLIDFDYVTLSSLNRHATAALADVGTPKVQCVARAVHAIAPFVQVDPRVELWRGGADGAELLEGADWVVGTWGLNFSAKQGKLCHLFFFIPTGHRCDRQYWYQSRAARALRTEQYQGVFLHGRWDQVGSDSHTNC
jgi:tRNA threonylcarbamoyladenosine dehydratase